MRTETATTAGTPRTVVKENRRAGRARGAGATVPVIDRRRGSAPGHGTSTLDELFGRVAARRPGAVAVENGRHGITYEGAQKRSGRLATAMLRSGVQLGDPVLVHCTDHVQTLVAHLAVLKVGGVCVPVPGGADEGGRERAAAVSGAELVLCSGATRRGWPLPAIVLDDERTWARITPLHIDRSLPRSSATDAAYLLVGREPTAAPTGHLIDHRAWLLALADRARRAGRAESGVLCCQEPGDPDTLTSLWWAISAGGTLYDRQPAVDGAGRGRPMAVGRYTAAVFSPRAYAAVLADAAQRPTARLGTVVLVGEPCPRELVERHFEALPYTKLLAEFAPVDGALPWAAVEHSREDEPLRAEPPNTPPSATPNAEPARAELVRAGAPHPGRLVGSAVPRVRITVRDAAGRAVPSGTVGEIWASGAALPFDRLGVRGAGSGPVAGAPFAVSRYRGRWREDGLLEVTGGRAGGLVRTPERTAEAW
ncbi:AMP-binding protein [Streptomyces sp. NPDC020141]|uniref:AMP-binding protein n=1 Tax=Streptomyces sp. NPDC020141 TaxID=3365065 RepID=UPI00378FE738